jgi:dihydrofolate synthase/folylpolyglutamate synthase
MRYHEAIEFLHGLTLFGSQFGLENPRQLAALAGNPQERLRFIHVAGTNGKGSTCAMLESIYRAAGLRVGLYTSPHLVHFSERIQVNRQPVPDADLARLVEQLRGAIHGADRGQAPDAITFFEFVTVLALMYFAEQKCDLVIWETGLGGRLDATNIVTPLASVITNIQFDHERWLGDTLAKIAAEKAGIIKPGVPVISSVEEPTALAVIQATAQRSESSLTVVTRADVQCAPLDRIKLPLLGGHQRLNAALALATVRSLRAQLPVSEKAMGEGLSSVRWPGRMQLIELPGGRQLLLDGAHNPAGAATLRDALMEFFPGAKPALILGALADKDCRAICEILAPLAPRVICAPVKSERTAAAEAIADICRRANSDAKVGASAGLAEALQAVAGEPFVMIAGSLYLIGEVMELLNLSAPTSTDEKRLNEWSVAATSRA